MRRGAGGAAMHFFLLLFDLRLAIMTLQVFQAVTLNTSAYQPHALLMRILSAEGPSILREYFRPRAHNKSHRQLGLVQIRIALQEVCNVIDC